MKKIEAYVKPHKLVDVTRAMHKVPGLHGLSVLDVRGFGRGKADGAEDIVQHEGFDYVPHLKVEAFCSDVLAEQVVSAIENAAHTGLRGDGKIFVSPVDDAVRISTGERGEGAV